MKLLLLLLLLPGLSFASSRHYHTEAEASSKSESESHAESLSESDSRSHSDAVANVGDVSVNMKRGSKIRNTPAAIAPDIYPSVSCFKPRSGAGSGPGLSLSFGGGKIDESCVRRETIRMGFQIGMVEQAQRMWCAEVVRLEAYDSIEDCLKTSPAPSSVEQQTKVYVEEAVEASQTAVRAELDALKAKVAQEQRSRRAAAQRAQERRKEVQAYAESIGIRG